MQLILKTGFSQVLFLIISINPVDAQVISIENTSFEYALPAIRNNLTIVVEDERCQNLIVKTNNGIIEKHEGDKTGCNYTFVPEKIGKAILQVYKVSKGDTTHIGDREYKISKWPPQIAKFANLESGTVEFGEFRANLAVVIPIQGVMMDGNIPVKSYLIRVLRGEKVILDLKNNGGSLEPQNHQALAQIQRGDKVLFENIVARMPGESYDMRMNDIRLVIK